MTPTLTVSLLKKTGTNVNSEPIFAPARALRVAPVKLLFTDQHTSVRTDSSGTHGHGGEVAANVILLAPASAVLGTNDVIELLGQRVTISALHLRFTASGRPDHIEVHCTQWV